MSLQGKNLADLRRESPKQSFSLSTAIRIGLQILNAIREIHSIGFYISNFAMGRTNATCKMVFMLDFGLARQYLNAKGEIRSPRNAAGFRGTVRYAAVSAHKNKDKDEVGRMKEEMNLNVLLDGCPRELHDFATYLKTLDYSDEPSYGLLENYLRNIIIRHGINIEEPYDWEINYENIGPKARLNGAVSTRNRSHTTALKDRLIEDKNRGLDTQAPITMGEEDDDHDHDQIGHHIKFSSNVEKETHDKPKYKRQEFMRPKYSAVNFDVIDAVNARLAAAASTSATTDLFSKLRIETSLENDEKKPGDVEVTFRIPLRTSKTVESQEKPNRLPKRHKTVPPNTVEKNSKSNRSLTFSSGKRYNKKLSDSPSVVEQTYAQADSETGVSSYLKAPTIISRWQGSFDESCGDGEAATNLDCLRTEKPDNNGSKYSPLTGRNCSNALPPLSRSSINSIDAKNGIQTQTPVSVNSNLSAYNVHLFTKTTELSSTIPSVTAVTPPQISVTPPVARALFTTPQTTAPTNVTFQPLLHAMAPTSSTVQSTSASLMMHFKNLVNTFNSFTNSNNAANATSHSSNISRSSGTKRLSFDNAISLQFRRSPIHFNTVNNINNDKNNDNVTNLNDYKDNNNIDPEKELRRQRRLRRRSICHEISSSNEHLFNNGVEVISTTDGKSQVAENAKWHILNLRRKRYQFLGLTPSPPRTAMQS
ncbi:Tau-tubulin kinase 1 [Dirofilaria immitis]|nr:Tau-tubulin kinase 1 [Dirofilaria immitis]